MADINLLRPKTKKLCELFIEACRKAGINLVITQTLRSMYEQDAYYSQGRELLSTVNAKRKKANLQPITEKENKSIITKAIAGSSPHNYGLAWDIACIVNGKVDYNNLELYKTCGSIAKPINFEGYTIEWGGDFKSIKDYPHFQLKNWKKYKERRRKMARKKVEEVVEGEKELELKVEEVIEEEKIDQKDCTLEDILEIKNSKSTLENEVKSHEMRIKNIGNELKVLNKDIENLEKVNFTKELSEDETKKLETKKLEVVELNRQLKVKIDKIEECKKEIKEYEIVLKEFAIAQYRKIVEKEIKLQDDRYGHIFEIKKAIDKIVQYEAELLEEEKHIIDLKLTLSNTVQIPNNIELPTKLVPMQAGQRKEIISKVKDLSLYLSKKVK